MINIKSIRVTSPEDRPDWMPVDIEVRLGDDSTLLLVIDPADPWHGLNFVCEQLMGLSEDA